MNPTLKSCPNCNQPYPSYEGFTDWCQACNWNVKAHHHDVFEDSLYDKFVKKLGDRFSKKLFEYVKTIQDVKPVFRWAAFVTITIAIGVIMLWFAFIAIDIWLVFQFPNFFAVIGFIICSLIIYLFRPQFIEPPEKTIARSDAPVLWSIIDELRVRLGASPIEYLVIDHNFNASMGYVGIRRKRKLTLGYPLLYILDAQETVELISHELAHDVNRDPMRGYFHWYAVLALNRWYYITYPMEILTTDAGISAMIFSVPFNLAMWCISHVFLGGCYLIFWLSLNESQKAEYYADYLAMTMSGNASTVSSFRKMTYHNFLELSVQQAVVQHREDEVFELFQAYISTIPDHEIERIQRENMLYESRVDSSHPPTPYRIGFAQSRGVIEPGFILDEERYSLLRDELKKFEPEISRTLVDEYRDWIYNR